MKCVAYIDTVARETPETQEDLVEKSKLKTDIEALITKRNIDIFSITTTGSESRWNLSDGIAVEDRAKLYSCIGELIARTSQPQSRRRCSANSELSTTCTSGADLDGALKPRLAKFNRLTLHKLQEEVYSLVEEEISSAAGT